MRVSMVVSSFFSWDNILRILASFFHLISCFCSCFFSYLDDADASPFHQNSSSTSPDDLVQDIISRLPAKYVLRCSTVCRRWKALTTSTPYFAELHQNHSFIPTILVEKLQTRPHHSGFDKLKNSPTYMRVSMVVSSFFSWDNILRILASFFHLISCFCSCFFSYLDDADASPFHQNSSSTSHLPWRPPPKFNQLPDELIQDIISRLPAKYVLRCSTVCRRWKALTTSTPYFAELHQNHSFIPTILVEKLQTRPHHSGFDMLKKKLYSFDGWETTHEKAARETLLAKRVKHMSPLSAHRHADADDEGDDDELTLFMHMAFSSCGLVVFHHQNPQNAVYDGFSRYCVILNPITGEKVTIRSNNSIRGQVYGIFYHPVIKESCILWVQVPILRGFYRRFLELKLLNLGPSQPCWRNIENISCFKTHIPRFNQGRGVDPPIVFDNVLYWMVNLDLPRLMILRVEENVRVLDDDEDRRGLTWPTCCQEAILSYDIKKEEFELLPHPGPCCKNREEASRNHRLMGLLETKNYDNVGGDLSMCQCSYKEGLINIWIFKKQEIDINFNAAGKVEKGLWIKQQSVKNFPFDGVCPGNDPYQLRPYSLINGQFLVVCWVGLGIVLHNLEMDTSELYLGSKVKSRDETTILFMCSHTHSFVSIGKSKSEILMETNPEILNIVTASHAPLYGGTVV